MITMSSIILTSGDFFAKGEYLVANSAYPVSLITVPSFKGPGLSVDQTDFNICVAHVRSVNEHCIGMLKRRWGVTDRGTSHNSQRGEGGKGHDHSHNMDCCVWHLAQRFD